MKEMSDDEMRKLEEELFSENGIQVMFSAEEADRLGIAKMCKDPGPKIMEKYYSQVLENEEDQISDEEMLRRYLESKKKG